MNSLLPSLAELIALRATLGRTHLGHSLRLPPSVLGRAMGAHLSSASGSGMEFAETRPYQTGDDLRSMDWRQTARRGKPFTKRYQAERERPLALLLDQSSSMQFGSRVTFKSVLAARAAALLAWQAAASGDRVGGGLCRVTDRGQAIFALLPSQRGTRGVLALLELMVRVDAVGAQSGGLLVALHALAERNRPGGRLVILSDFHCVDKEWPALTLALQRLARHQSLSLIQIFDPLEVHPPPPNNYALADAQQVWQLDLSDPLLRAAWGHPYRTRYAALAALAQSLPANHLPLSTAAPLDEVLLSCSAAQRRHP